MLLGVAGRAAVAADTPPFERGAAAFEHGDFDSALRWFLEARRAGLDTPGLHYDLGATYYRLGRYTEAEAEFAALARQAEWSALATYNLGLIAQRTGRIAAAREYYGEALRTAQDRKLRELAARALGRLELQQPTRTLAVASLAAGYDSNATLTPDAATAGTSHQGDLFAEALGALSHRLSGNAAGGVTAQGGFLLRKYQDLHQFDQLGLRLGAEYDSAAGPWQTSAAAFYDTMYFGGDPFQRAGVVEARAGRRAGSGVFRARYEYQHIEGGAGFEYLDGWQQQLSLEAALAWTASVARFGYQLELNDRRDLQQGTDFLSFSPTRHSVFAALTAPAVGGWSADARAEYRFSRYDDPYVLGGETTTREDRRFGVALHASRRVSGPWRVFVDYSGYRNDSSIGTYAYTRHQALAGIEAVMEK
ncbi:MAG TPA: tetratricopeptide repeat protein [Burkholderiales bacterium]|nr:tetratricopeptide repeat protein [Burkholderiales bacterium]